MLDTWTNPHQDPAAWARQLGISLEAVQLYLASEVIDLHTDSFLWQRLIGYRMERRHAPPRWGRRRFGGQVDFPRVLEAAMAGVVWDIPTNPLVFRARKYAALRGHIDQILSRLRAVPEHFQHVVSYSDYQAARAAGKVASWISIQGGQAIDNNLYDLARIPEVHRITLVHFTPSRIGASNFDPLNARRGLSAFGRDFVAEMVRLGILVDLSHINRPGFFDALAVMDRQAKQVPPIVTHTGVRGVCDIWRNLDDAQIKAIAARNGTIGVIYEQNFLARSRADQTLARIVEQLDYIIALVGEDHVSLGSDYDGMITLPHDFGDITEQPKLVAEMLRRGWSAERIQKILGLNFLRVVQVVRP